MGASTLPSMGLAVKPQSSQQAAGLFSPALRPSG